MGAMTYEELENLGNEINNAADACEGVNKTV
jgi:hypothetical protein